MSNNLPPDSHMDSYAAGKQQAVATMVAEQLEQLRRTIAHTMPFGERYQRIAFKLNEAANMARDVAEEIEQQNPASEAAARDRVADADGRQAKLLMTTIGEALAHNPDVVPPAIAEQIPESAVPNYSAYPVRDPEHPDEVFTVLTPHGGRCTHGELEDLLGFRWQGSADVARSEHVRLRELADELADTAPAS